MLQTIKASLSLKKLVLGLKKLGELTIGFGFNSVTFRLEITDLPRKADNALYR